MTVAEKLNPKQHEAVAHGEGPLLVLAGAGSGKTRIVTFRIAYLIESGVQPDKILAVTFTNKAAGEMQERVHQLSQEHYLQSYPTICTFHSLGCKILRESIHHLGYKSNFIIYDEEDANKLLKGIKTEADMAIDLGKAGTLGDKTKAKLRIDTSFIH